MATVPQYQRQVKTQPLANSRRSSMASPELLGADARNLQQAGQGLQQAGSGFAKVSYQIQERENTDRVMQAEAALKEAEAQFHLDVKNRRGQNAWGATRDATKWWQEAERKYSEPLSNEAQQRAFKEMILRRRTSSLSVVSDHEARQRRQSLLDSSKASIKSSIDSAAASYESPEVVEQERRRINSTVRAIANLEGWDKERTDQALSDNLTMLHKRVIEAKLEDDPLSADEYYREHKDDIGGADRAAIKSSIRQATTLGKAQGHADRIMSKVKDPAEQLREAKKIEDPDTRKTTEILVKQYQAQAKAALEADQEQALDDTWRILNNGGDRNAIPQRTWNRLSGDGQKRVNDYLEKRAEKELKGREVDDFSMLDEAERRIEQGDITDPRQLQEYEPYLRDATLRTLRKTIAKRGEVKATDMRRAFEDRLGERRSKWSDSEREQWLAFQEYITEHVQETKRPEDVDVWADRWFMEGYGVKDRLWSNDPDTFGEARTEGRDDFVIKTPKQAQSDVLGAMEMLRRNSDDAVPEGDLATDEFYTRYYLDAQRYLNAQDMNATPGRVAAYAILRQRDKPITVRNLDFVAGQLQ